MDERVAFLRLKELSHVRRADFHLQSRGDAIECLYPLAGQILPMLVQVDESRRDHKSGSMDHAFRLQRCVGDSRNASILNANVADRIRLGFRIDDASAHDHDVVLLGEQE